MNEMGQGILQNHAEAAMWYRWAAEQGNVFAQSKLGYYYYVGRGIPQNYAEAVKWSRRAAEQGDADAQFSLGRMFQSGEGVPRDYVQAHKWYNLAAANFPSGREQDRDTATRMRDLMCSLMTSAQVAEAQRLASEWSPGPGASWRDQSEPVEQSPGVTDKATIAAVQEALRQLGYDSGPSDGAVGPLPETGQITPDLIQELSAAFYERT